MPSPAGTRIPRDGSSLVDGLGGTWTIDSAGWACRNGKRTSGHALAIDWNGTDIFALSPTKSMWFKVVWGVSWVQLTTVDPDPKITPPAPTITNATATPAALPAGGGSVTVNATVINATSITVDGVVKTLPATISVIVSRSILIVATGVTAPPASAQVAVSVAVPPPPPPATTIEFTNGVPGSIDVSALLPAGAARYTGGYYTLGTDDELPGIAFNPTTKILSYDGSPIVPGYPVNPNTHYALGGEVGPYNTHWQYPPTTHVIPYPRVISGTLTHVAIDGGGKHTRPRYCPWDNKIYIFGGDYSTYGLQGGTSSSGRSLIWKLDPTLASVESGWTLAYPAKGRVGEDQPLSPDIMGFSWDPTRQIWWITWGITASGYTSDAGALPGGWKADGGLSTVWPLVSTPGNQTDAPAFTFDPKLALPKYTKLGVVPWNTWGGIRPCESAYDDMSKRLYALSASPTASIRAWILDTTVYDTNPAGITWSSVDIDLSVGSVANLTGGDYSTCTGQYLSPSWVDDATRRLYFYDAKNRAVLALTLPGHAAGTHKVQLVASIAGMTDSTSYPQGTLSQASSPFMWIPEHRSLVLMTEPLQQMVGPQSYSVTINVDTGALTEGPRFPTNPKDGLPWFPNAGVWYPPTQEIVLYHCYGSNYDKSRSWLRTSPTGGGDWPWTVHRYKWAA